MALSHVLVIWSINCKMKFKVLPLSYFFYKSDFFNSFCTYFCFYKYKKASNIDLAGNVWFDQDANISSKNTQSTCRMKIYSSAS